MSAKARRGSRQRPDYGRIAELGVLHGHDGDVLREYKALYDLQGTLTDRAGHAIAPGRHVQFTRHHGPDAVTFVQQHVDAADKATMLEQLVDHDDAVLLIAHVEIDRRKLEQVA